MILRRLFGVTLIIEVVLLKDLLCAPMTDTTLADSGTTNLAGNSAGLKTGDSTSVSSSLAINIDTSSSNSFKTIDVGGADVIVASGNLNNAQETVSSVGSPVKLEPAVSENTASDQGFSNSVSLTGDALSGTGTGESLVVGTEDIADKHAKDESFDTKGDAFNAETIKTVESTGGASETPTETEPTITTEVQTIKLANTGDGNAGANAVEVQVVETLKTVEEKAVNNTDSSKSGNIDTQNDTSIVANPVIDISTGNIETKTSTVNGLIDTPASFDPPPLLTVVTAKPPEISRSIGISGFLDTSVHTAIAAERITAPVLVPIENPSDKSKTPANDVHPLEGKIFPDMAPNSATDTVPNSTNEVHPLEGKIFPDTNNNSATSPDEVHPLEGKIYPDTNANSVPQANEIHPLEGKIFPDTSANSTPSPNEFHSLEGKILPDTNANVFSPDNEVHPLEGKIFPDTSVINADPSGPSNELIEQDTNVNTNTFTSTKQFTNEAFEIKPFIGNPAFLDTGINPVIAGLEIPPPGVLPTKNQPKNSKITNNEVFTVLTAKPSEISRSIGISGFLDTSVHTAIAAERITAPVLVPIENPSDSSKTPANDVHPLEGRIFPDTSVNDARSGQSKDLSQQNTNLETQKFIGKNTFTGITENQVATKSFPTSTIEENIANKNVFPDTIETTNRGSGWDAFTNTQNAVITVNKSTENIKSGSKSRHRFGADTFTDKAFNEFLTEGSKRKENQILTGHTNGDLLDTTASDVIDWNRILNPITGTLNNRFGNQQASTFSQTGKTVNDHNSGSSMDSNIENNFFDIQTTTVEPEYQGKSQSCEMKKHPDPTKFISSGLVMPCPPSLVWKQSKCYCDYPGPGDQIPTIHPSQNGGCDFLLRLGMENTYQNEFKQFKVGTRSRRHRITFENVKGGSGLSAHIVRSPLLVNAFQGNDLTSTMHINFKFRIANRRLNSRRLMILVSNGCGSSWNGPQPPSIALKFIPRNTTFKLVFRTDGKSIVQYLQPQLQPRDGWYNVALYLQDQWLNLEVNGETLYSSNGMKGSVIRTPCPLKITGNTFEGYIDEFEVAKKCRYEPKVV